MAASRRKKLADEGATVCQLHSIVKQKPATKQTTSKVQYLKKNHIVKCIRRRLPEILVFLNHMGSISVSLCGTLEDWSTIVPYVSTDFGSIHC